MKAVSMRTVDRWFRDTWSDYPGWLVYLVVFSVLNAVVITAFPWLWQYVVDALESPDAGTTTLTELGIWLLVVGAGQSLLYVFLQGARTLLNAWIQRRTRARVFGHMTELPDAFYARWRAGDLVTRLTDDAGEKTAWFLCSGVFRALEAALIVVVCFGAMLWVDPNLTIWVVLPLPLLIVAQAALQGVLGRRFGAVQSAISGIGDQLTATFGGIRIVQASGLEATARRKFVAEAERQRAAEVRVADVQQLVNLMYGYGWQLAVGVLLFVGGPRVIAGEISLGQFVAFEGFLMTMVWPMFDVGIFLSKYMQAGVALERLEELLAEPLPAAPTAAAVPQAAGVAIRGVDVQAPDGTVLLRGVDLDLRPGELVAVVGEVGSGKSTLMRLLAGAAPPSRGELLVGGVAPGEADRTALREHIAYVPQDPVVLSLKVRDNITLGRDVAEADLARALRVSRLAQDLPALPQGLDTPVGERGVTLSGGQQQRVGLARALVGRPRLLLLDDATAALDADTEAAFWAELEAVLPDVTAVVVTHRIGTLERADRVVVLEGGRVVQQGRHADLVERDGPYRRIYARNAAVTSSPVAAVS
jgi:ATP-binding cassette subfamily B multidrug efflux pump